MDLLCRHLFFSDSVSKFEPKFINKHIIVFEQFLENRVISDFSDPIKSARLSIICWDFESKVKP